MLYIAYAYKKEDCDCKYCLYYSHGKCKLPWCCCYEDKVRTGSPFTKDMQTKIKNRKEKDMETDHELAEWYVDEDGKFMSRQIHHDGTNY